MTGIKEILEELKLVFSGRNAVIDAAIPPVGFILVNTVFGFTPAVWTASGAALAIILLRLVRRQPVRNALGGAGTALLAVLLVFLLNSSEAYFLPTLVNGAVMVVILTISVLVKRPAVAWTSFLTRRWPWEWYWHPKIRPAYSEVTILWVVYSGLKLALQWMFFRQGRIETLAVFNLVSGWPALIVLLIISYMYGMKRLRALRGPSVEEFKEGSPPPWEGQKRGF